MFERRPNDEVEAGNSWQDTAYTQWYSGMCFAQTMGIKVEGWSQAGGLECPRIFRKITQFHNANEDFFPQINCCIKKYLILLL